MSKHPSKRSNKYTEHFTPVASIDETGGGDETIDVIVREYVMVECPPHRDPDRAERPGGTQARTGAPEGCEAAGWWAMSFYRQKPQDPVTYEGDDAGSVGGYISALQPANTSAPGSVSTSTSTRRSCS